LGSLGDQESAPLEVIVVDSSTDDTREIIRQRFPGVRLHHVEKRIFPGPARNTGASMARGSVIAFLDADCITAPDWVQQIAARHAEGHMVVGGAIEVGNPTSGVAWAGHLSEFREFLPAGEPRYISHIPTCNLSYRKSLFESRGGFPNAYYPQEDLLFNHALNLAGIRIWFDPAIRVRHFCREGLREYLSHQHRIGRVTRCVLRRMDMPGSPIARRGWLAWLASPALGMVKLLRTMAAFFVNFPGEALRRPDVLVLLTLGSIWWTRGFAAGARTGLSGIRGWADPSEPIFAVLTPRGVVPRQEERSQ
jgi:glycosyltransferase involved in cell wall biosynthesis